MAKTTAKVVDQLEASRRVRRSRGEFLFNGAGEVLELLRADRKWSLAKVAKMLGIAPSTVLRYEKNRVPLSDYAVARFAEVYAVEADQLMLDCVKKVLPSMKDSPFGKMLEEVINSRYGNE